MSYSLGTKYSFLPNNGKHTTALGLRVADLIEWAATKLGLVSARRHEKLAQERNKFIRELHHMAIQLNKLEDENAELKFKLSRSPNKKRAFR